MRVHPGARRAGLAGRLADGALKVEVREPPEGGRANRALEELLAGALGLARGQVRVVRGAGARAKQVEVEGLEAEEVWRRLEAALAGGPARRAGGARGEREAGHGG